MARSFFYLWRFDLSDILIAQNAFSKLLDLEYEFILGRKNKIISLVVEFQKFHFFHIAGLQHLRDLPRLSISAEEVYNQLESGKISVDYNGLFCLRKKIERQRISQQFYIDIRDLN